MIFSSLHIRDNSNFLTCTFRPRKVEIAVIMESKIKDVL